LTKKGAKNHQKMRIFEKFKQAASCKGEGFKRVKFGEGRKYGRKEGRKENCHTLSLYK